MSRVEVIGDATLYLGDCLEIMPTLPSLQSSMVFTSPPYNLGEGMEDKGGLRVGHAGSKWKDGKLRAGVNLGRKFCGIELNPRYFDIACRRIEQAYKQRPLFEAEPPKTPEQMVIA